jgi:hypothetical protein
LLKYGAECFFPCVQKKTLWGSFSNKYINFFLSESYSATFCFSVNSVQKFVKMIDMERSMKVKKETKTRLHFYKQGVRIVTFFKWFFKNYPVNFTCIVLYVKPMDPKCETKANSKVWLILHITRISWDYFSAAAGAGVLNLW